MREETVKSCDVRSKENVYEMVVDARDEQKSEGSGPPRYRAFPLCTTSVCSFIWERKLYRLKFSMLHALPKGTKRRLSRGHTSEDRKICGDRH